VMNTQSAKSKLPDVQVPRLSVTIPKHSLLKAKQAVSGIAQFLGRSTSNISHKHNRVAVASKVAVNHVASICMFMQAKLPVLICTHPVA
jgi:hypothetical protein